MNLLAQNKTGRITEAKVRQKLELIGLKARKPVPDTGVDLEAINLTNPDKIARIQIKGRNPKKIKSLRWFQLRVTKNQLEAAREKGIPAEETWKRETERDEPEGTDTGSSNNRTVKRVQE